MACWSASCCDLEKPGLARWRGAQLSWLLLMTLWMPLLNYAQSYNAGTANHSALTKHQSWMRRILGPGQEPDRCLRVSRAFAFGPRPTRHPMRVAIWQTEPECIPIRLCGSRHMAVAQHIRHPVDREENVLLFKNAISTFSGEQPIFRPRRRREHDGKGGALAGYAVNQQLRTMALQPTCLTMAKPKPVPPVSRERLRSTR
jgi:hypothetical protein